uniref:Reverse transcriptase zinc-binding domain-containing protein n=1 Tax=Fagus sylvatica TaxID=28930 RepID=A0A2N9HZ86_FAGSY
MVCDGRLGMALSVDVWHDTWSERPLVRGRDITGVQQVADLLDSTRGTWDMEIVDRVFNVQSVTKGKQIPLPMGLLGDRMGWSYEKHGEFSLWKSKTPGKSKHLIWRAYHNILPTRANLFQRHIVSTPECLVCQQEEEDVSHTLWGCPYARDVWSLTSLRLQKSLVSADDFSHIARYLFWRLSKDERHQ